MSPLLFRALLCVILLCAGQPGAALRQKRRANATRDRLSGALAAMKKRQVKAGKALQQVGRKQKPGYVYPPDATVLLAARKQWGAEDSLNSWNLSHPCSRWAHVVCDDSGRVMELNLGNVSLSGGIPSDIGKLAALEHLDLEHNQLKGSIPSSIGSLTALTWLGLHFNQLSGPIPHSIGGLTALEWLGLENNRLSGSIPSTFGSLTSLWAFDLGFNQLSGTIPAGVWDLTNVIFFQLPGNNLSRTIPPSIGQLTNIEYIWMYSNRFTGTIPSAIGELSELQGMSLAGNQLSGPIPFSVGQMPELWGLFLSANQLTGSIPRSFFRASTLQFLDLSSNQLSGSLYSSIHKMVSLQFLDVSSNRLSGPLPSGISKLTGITSLDVSNNWLTGSLLPLPNSTVGRWNFTNNFLSGSCPNSSKPLNSTFYGNCFRGCSPKDAAEMRTPEECSFACGSDQAAGPCLGHGACIVKGPNDSYTGTCRCNRGFFSPPSSPGTCVTAPPPPPGSVVQPCAGEVPGPKRCKCPPGACCVQKHSYGIQFVCRCVGTKTPVTDPKTGLLKACI